MSVEAGVQGVPRHTQYLTIHLVETMFFLKIFDLGTCVHTQYSVASIDPEMQWSSSALNIYIFLITSNKNPGNEPKPAIEGT